MEKRSSKVVLQHLFFDCLYVLTTLPRTLFATGVMLMSYWLGCVVYLGAVGRFDGIPAVLLRVAVAAVVVVLGAVFHRVVGNDDQAWHYYMFWKKRRGNDHS